MRAKTEVRNVVAPGGGWQKESFLLLASFENRHGRGASATRVSKRNA